MVHPVANYYAGRTACVQLRGDLLVGGIRRQSGFADAAACGEKRQSRIGGGDGHHRDGVVVRASHAGGCVTADE